MNLLRQIQIAETLLTLTAAAVSAYCMFILLGWQVPAAFFIAGFILSYMKHRALQAEFNNWVKSAREKP